MTRNRPFLEWALILFTVLWFVGVPLVAATFTALNPNAVSGSWREPAFTLAAVGVQIGGLMAAVALSKLIRGWDRLFAVSISLALAASWLLFVELSQALFPAPSPYRHNPHVGPVQLLLGIPAMLLLGGLLIGRLRRQKLWIAWQSMGLSRTGSLGWGLGAAAVALGLWLVVGSLGDAGESFIILVQALATGLLTEWLWRGLIYSLLLTAIPQRGWAVLLGGVLYLVYATAAGLSQGLFNGLGQTLLALPLTLLVTELWLRPGAGRQGVWGAVAFHTLSLAVPELMVDPRPMEIEPTHALAALATLVLTMGIGLLLLAWRLLWSFKGKRSPDSRRRSAAIALAPWAAVLVAYLTLGVPGFANDGYLIILKEQTNLTAVDRSELYQVLVQTAQKSQGEIRAELERMKLDYRPYYLVNMIRVDGSTRGMQQMAQRSEVERVLLNPNMRSYAFHQAQPYFTGDATKLPWGLDAIEADQVWEMGITGQGVVVGGQDTGYEWYHPELKDSYRGWDGHTVDHNRNWHDAWGNNPTAFDDRNHGTHTMGTAVGNTVGMAPDAQWIGCRSMRNGIGNPGAYVECMEFFFAPYPLNGDPFQDGDPNLAPHVVNNSWGCPPEEGCVDPEPIHTAVEVTRAAGIMMVTSAGNDGPACNTIWTPANEDAVFSVGASNALEQIVYFSSRGPGPRNITKPDVVAPGVDVVSSTPYATYGVAEGTSMASPHVAGLVALLWSANPKLMRDIDMTEAIITQTAEPKNVTTLCTSATEGPCACGQNEPGELPNNVYGYGLIDALEAIQVALELEE